jgi:hypothetical protein
LCVVLELESGGKVCHKFCEVEVLHRS